MSPHSTENQEKEDKPKEESKEPAAEEEKTKTVPGPGKEESTSFMSCVFAVLQVYLAKILVSLHTGLLQGIYADDFVQKE